MISVSDQIIAVYPSRILTSCSAARCKFGPDFIPDEVGSTIKTSAQLDSSIEKSMIVGLMGLPFASGCYVKLVMQSHKESQSMLPLVVKIK